MEMKWCPVSVCCAGNLQDKDDDLELLDNCFSKASNLTESERSTVYYIYIIYIYILYIYILYIIYSILYYICGYVSFKENLPVSDGVVTLSYESEFTELVSRGKLKHPSPELYDLALYLYSFFKNRHSKCCSRVFLQGFMYIYYIYMYIYD